MLCIDEVGRAFSWCTACTACGVWVVVSALLKTQCSVLWGASAVVVCAPDVTGLKVRGLQHYVVVCAH